MFSGFSDETVRFFLDLKFHNSTAFFRQEHDRYLETVQKPFYEMIRDLSPMMIDIDPLMEIRPNKCLSHIHRDTRFTRDKSPYRDHHWFLFRRAGEPREQSLNYFFEFGPDRLNWGMGFWGENRNALDIFRNRLQSKPEEITGILDPFIRRCRSRNLSLGGSVHKRLPCPATVPERLKRWYLIKEMYIVREEAPYEWAFSDRVLKETEKDFGLMAPVYRLFRGITDESLSGRDMKHGLDDA